MGQQNSKGKVLLALDFDHTILDSNTDVEIQDLALDGEIPKDVKQMYSKQCWTDYMQAVFELLHRQGRTEADYRRYICRLPLAPGMEELLKTAADCERVDTIIISDSNTLFIEWILEAKGLTADRVFSNPAHFDEEHCLRIAYYHTQDWCELSTKNMCKGHVLEEHMKAREKEGSKYSRVVYVGDGKNDLCPGTKLKKGDVLCARKGFTMANLLSNTERKIPLRANVVHYSNGKELIGHLGVDLESAKS